MRYLSRFVLGVWVAMPVTLNYMLKSWKSQILIIGPLSINVFFKYLWFFANGDEFVDSHTDWRGSVANSASQNTKSLGCTSSTPLSDSRDTSLARRRTSLRRASARTSSPRSSTSTAAPQMTRSGPYIFFIILSFPTLQTVAFLYLFVSEARCSWFCPWAAAKSKKIKRHVESAEVVLNQQTAAFIRRPTE